jgi:hypothetical protein
MRFLRVLVAVAAAGSIGLTSEARADSAGPTPSAVQDQVRALEQSFDGAGAAADLSIERSKAVCQEGFGVDGQFDVSDLDVGLAGMSLDCSSGIWVAGLITYDFWSAVDFYGAGGLLNTDLNAATGCAGADFAWAVVDDFSGGVYRTPSCSSLTWTRTGDISGLVVDGRSFGVGIPSSMLGGHRGNISVLHMELESWYDGPDVVGTFFVATKDAVQPPSQPAPRPSPAPAPVADRNCSDFGSQEDAQAWHNLHPSAALDGDRDGVACESNARAGEFWNGRCAISRAEGVTNNSVARLYGAYFRRPADQGGLNYWVPKYRSGEMCLADISNYFATSHEFVSTYGAVDNANFVRLVYVNVLGREPDAAGYNYWSQQITFGGMTRGAMMIGFSESREFRGITQLA